MYVYIYVYIIYTILSILYIPLSILHVNVYTICIIWPVLHAYMNVYL